MTPYSCWRARARPDAPCLILPDHEVLRFRDLPPATNAVPSLMCLSGPNGVLARGLIAAAASQATAFPLPPGLSEADQRRLIALAEAERRSAIGLIIATSGSTGVPKGVKLSWRALSAAARLSNRALAFSAGDVWLCPLPLYHIGGAIIVYRALRAGATAVIHDRFDPTRIAEDLVRQRVTHVSLVPAMLARLMEAAVSPPPSLRVALIGGAALSQTLFERARAAGWPLVPSYGMSETCAVAVAHRFPDASWTSGDAGRPLPGVRVRIDAQGRIQIATPARMSGYLGHPPQSDEWLATADLGAIDERGHLQVLGRADELINSGGVKLHPLAIEERLAACPGVREALVVGLPDPVWGEIVACAYHGEADETSVDDWCRQMLPSAQRPRRIKRLPTLPRTPSGKPDRRALAALWLEAP